MQVHGLQEKKSLKLYSQDAVQGFHDNKSCGIYISMHSDTNTFHMRRMRRQRRNSEVNNTHTLDYHVLITSKKSAL